MVGIQLYHQYEHALFNNATATHSHLPHPKECPSTIGLSASHKRAQ
jgi:hypothetical protein